jgi:hypothetical protein
LTISSGPVTGFVSFLLADVRAAPRPAVPALAFEMIDAAPQIEPNDGIGRAMLFSLLLARKLGHRVLRSALSGTRTSARNSAAYFIAEISRAGVIM